ncbi:MAG TPA: DUF5597 domain-containing protein [Opitutaceae bacterium]|jgi:hypothetical protein
MSISRLFAALSLLGLPALPAASGADAPIPRFAEKGGRHALLVDGAPFLVLGGQCGNSSAWPSELPGVWAAVEGMHANTLEAPVYWEQFEPQQGSFDTSIVDQMIREARARHVRLILLWFGTWKNGSSHYMPLWMKGNPALYTHVIGADGVPVDSPSPFCSGALDLDRNAFRHLMRHLRQADPERTVIMVQVENESGTWGSVRDFSPQAQRIFAQPVPGRVLAAMGSAAAKGSSWAAAFGAHADEYFHAWAVASYVGKVAAAGKEEYPLPMYTNAALRDPISPGAASTYESGGPTDNVLPIWKAAAPALDVLAPDIYQGSGAKYRRVLELYSKADNPLIVPETIGAARFSSMLFAAIGAGAVGWSPFGIDRAIEPGSPPRPRSEEPLQAVGIDYRILGPVAREVAALALEGRLKAVAESAESHVQEMDFGPWKAVAKFGAPVFGFGREPKGNPEPVGGAIVGDLGGGTFLVAGRSCRVDFVPVGAPPAAHREFLRVEEGIYDGGRFTPTRIWNGDQTDYGLNLGTAPVALRVSVRTF